MPIPAIKRKPGKTSNKITHVPIGGRYFWIGGIAGLLLVLVIVFFRPWGIRTLSSHPHPAASYTAAVRRIESLRTQEAGTLAPVCDLQFLTHGRKAKRVVVFVHGITNCPRQFKELGEEFFARDYNVLTVPLPHHGLADRMTEDLARLTAAELAAYADQVMDIARGLGDKVTMVGLSVGANVTAWAAQERHDLDRAVVMAPVFGYQGIPVWLTTPATNLGLVYPNEFKWWDPVRKADGAVIHSYPRFATRAMAQALRLGLAVQNRARRTPPAARHILVVTNAADTVVYNGITREMAENWRKHGGKVKIYEFPARLKLIHDLIDPTQPGAKPRIVYPTLIELMTQ